MKALPLWQPWATLVANQRKRIETRSWPAPRYVLGERVAIHATKGGLRTNQELELLATPEFFACLWSEVPNKRFADVTPNAISWVLPRGAIVATAVVDRCLPIDAERARALAATNPTEYAFGDYTPGRFAWVLRDVERLAEPIPFKGRQGIFDVPDELLGLAPVQLALPEVAA